jgi:DNA replication and repair protein RecF
MIVESLSLQNYRNYENLSLNFSDGTNIFYGNNAQGKTNILEAVYMSGTTKSHRTNKDLELIRFSEEESHISTMVKKNGISHKIDIHLKNNKSKGVAIDGIPIKKASELFGMINFVFFSPEDLNIIKNGPAEKRRFMDIELCQLNKIYLSDLANYNKIVIQRNKLLKDLYFRGDFKDTLDIWDLQLCEYGQKIIEMRESFIERLNEIIFDIHHSLSGGKENLKIVYLKNCEKENFMEQLRINRERDIKLKTTSVGPHRDDLGFLFDGMDVRKFGSQGQQRCAALSLKLSEIELVKSVTKDTPILLLDDVLSELDKNRQNYLLNHIHDIQAMITCTGLDEFVNCRFSIDKIFKVTDGTVVSEN